MKQQKLFGVAILAALLGLIFSIPLLPMQSRNTVSHTMLNAVDSSYALVFFGFTGCKDVCPGSLSVLRQVLALKESKTGGSLPSVIFVDIDRHSNQRRAEQYAQQYDKRFIGYHATEQDLNRLSQQFGLNIRQRGDQINHRGRTYLLEERNGQWSIEYAINPQGLSADWLVNTLSQEG